MIILTISPEIYRVGDNRRTVNTSMTPYISDQSGTENACKTQLGGFIVMVGVLACNSMYRYEHHFGSFYHNPTILEKVSILACKHVSGSTRKSFFIEIQWQGIILAPMCFCRGKMWKSHVTNIFHIPHWPVGVTTGYSEEFPWLRNHLLPHAHSWQPERQNIITWQQCSVTMSTEI